MPDPGYSYLYNKSPKRSPSASAGPYQPGGGGGSGAGSPARSGSHSRLQHGSHAPTAAPSEPGHLAANGQLGKWEAALGNIEDARVTLDTLAHAVDDAVYLDEDAYNQVQPKVAYLKTIQAQQARVATLTMETQELQKHLATAEQTRRRSDLQVKAVQSELENNSAVFKLHYNEILAKNEEIKTLQAVIEGLSSGRTPS